MFLFCLSTCSCLFVFVCLNIIYLFGFVDGVIGDVDGVIGDVDGVVFVFFSR